MISGIAVIIATVGTWIYCKITKRPFRPKINNILRKIDTLGKKLHLPVTVSRYIDIEDNKEVSNENQKIVPDDPSETQNPSID